MDVLFGRFISSSSKKISLARVFSDRLGRDKRNPRLTVAALPYKLQS